MTFLKTAFTSAALSASGLLAMAPDDAGAQVRVQIGGRSGFGYGQGGYGVGSGTNWGHSGYGYGGSAYRSGSYGSGVRYGRSSALRYGGSQGGWHDTSHYDYHPTSVVPHGNHYHVIPGHYDYHQSGHRH